MRVLCDSNVFISYLLHNQMESPIRQLMDAVISRTFTLLLPGALLDEFVLRIESKPYLAARIHPDELAAAVALWREIGETVPQIHMPIPAVTRNPKDDYLLAYAVVGQADFSVTGDMDLLILGTVGALRIVTPREMVEIIRSEA
ncbi:MAG: putative toxin-antitoxin system toxin component, PIN family [Caldilineaceae bacterium]